MNPFWNATTPDKTKLDLACSILQKAIRRGEETAAVWAIKEIYRGKKQKLFGCDIWRKLYIYAGEEVGLADNLMPLRLQDLEYASKRIAMTANTECVTKDADLLYLIMAVMILCRVKKSQPRREGH
jgi:replication-associated recombination protein RarA